MPIDYSKAKIYCIRSPNTDLIYIGATCQSLCQRMSGHRKALKRNRGMTSKVILEFGDAYIELLENYPCNSKEELSKKEGEYIRSQNCCNKIIPDRTRDEWYTDNRDSENEKKRQYYQTNKEKIAEQAKQYREANKEVEKERLKKYYELNKQAINEKHKKYREANKDKINENQRKQYYAKKNIDI